MANEIKITLQVTVAKGYLNYTFTPGQMLADLATARRGGNVQTIGTSAEVVTDGDVATPSLCILRNLDATNYITIGPQSGTTSGLEPMCRLAAGRAMLLWLDPSVVLMAQANTAACDLQVDIFEA